MTDANKHSTADTDADADAKASSGTQSHPSLGEILIDAGRLSTDNADIILRLQREHGTNFGETAINLGLLTKSDVDMGLARQFDFPYLQKGESDVSTELIAAYEPFSLGAEALRALRSQLMLRWFDQGKERNAMAIASAARGEGRSLLTANLAIVFSQLGLRTLLIDADMRNSRQHQLFGLPNRDGLSALLAGRSGAHAIAAVPGLPDLALLPAGPVPPNPQELLSRPLFLQVLQQLKNQFDVILIDTPPTDLCADAHSVAARAGAALVVARNNVSHMKALRNLALTMGETRAVIVGTVLNEF